MIRKLFLQTLGDGIDISYRIVNSVEKSPSGKVRLLNQRFRRSLDMNDDDSWEDVITNPSMIRAIARIVEERLDGRGIIR